MKKEVIILTKSDKHSGYCVAGIDRETGEWIRIVSSDEATERSVPYRDLIADDGKEVNIYDIVEIVFIRHLPTRVQPENYLYDETVEWKKIGRSNLSEVIQIHGFDRPECVFGNNNKSLEPDEIRDVRESLLLLQVENPRYDKKTFSNRSVFQLDFTYNNKWYSYFKITQQDLKREYEDAEDGLYPATTDIFVFSLTDQYRDGKYYKVVAQALE